ncbi:MAG: hypothetical protein JO281_06545 [Pseudonocardiales bacterium]|nr:hypothetical protein [Pseudonocardiales bacterium]
MQATYSEGRAQVVGVIVGLGPDGSESGCLTGNKKNLMLIAQICNAHRGVLHLRSKTAGMIV